MSEGTSKAERLDENLQRIETELEELVILAPFNVQLICERILDMSLARQALERKRLPAAHRQSA